MQRRNICRRTDLSPTYVPQGKDAELAGLLQRGPHYQAGHALNRGTTAPPATSIAFNVTRYGRSDDIEVVEATSNATSVVTRDIVGRVEGSRFRPRVTDGKVTDTFRVTGRYFFTE